MEDVRNGLTRRDLLKVGAAAGGAAAGFSALDPNLMEALAWGPRCGQLKDIEHFVIFMNENRSFDHYFGTYRGVRGSPIAAAVAPSPSRATRRRASTA